MFALAISLFIAPAQSQNSCRGAVSGQNNLNPESNILAVHLTNYFPKSGYVRASAENLGRFLVTLHFALGQTVVDHQNGNWSKHENKHNNCNFRNFNKPIARRIWIRDRIA